MIVQRTCPVSFTIYGSILDGVADEFEAKTVASRMPGYPKELLAVTGFWTRKDDFFPIRNMSADCRRDYCEGDYV